MSILITTYEGTHNHQLPLSATNIASTTAAAASILLSGNSTSSQSASATETISNRNYTLHNNPRLAGSYYSPSNSFSPLHPTVTLDLTTPSSSSSSPSTSFNFNKFGASQRQPFSSTSFNFSSFPETSNVTQNSFWGTSFSSLPYSQLQFGSSYYPTKQAKDQIFTETLTKAIASDPSFQTVIAAAVSSMVGSGNPVQAEQMGHTLESYGPVQQTGNGKGCGGYFSNLLLSKSRPRTVGSDKPEFPASIMNCPPPSSPCLKSKKEQS